MMTRTVHLGGWLGDKYGKKHVLAGKSVWHLMQGLIFRHGPQFREDVREHSWHVLKGRKNGKDDIGEIEVRSDLGDTKTLHVLPAVQGSSGAIRTIVGVVLVVAGLYFQQPWLVNVGAAMAIGGVVEMLTRPPPGSQPTDEVDRKQSYFFNGGKNTLEPGGPVPLVYGRVGSVSSTIISIGFTNEVL